MLTLFETSHQFSVGNVTHPEFAYLKAGLARELRKFENYYRANPMVVRSGHLIVQMLQSLHANMTYDVDTFIDVACDRATALAMAFKLTTPATPGKLHPGVFYGPDIKEAILLTTTPLDVGITPDQWKSVASVRVIDHPYDSLGFWVADGITELEGTGYATIEINLPRLALQYRMWLETRSVDLIEESKPALTQFVHRYVLPNMMRSHLDLAIINRATAAIVDDIPSPEYPRHPFYVVKYDRQFDRIMHALIDRAKKRRMTFPQLLEGLPTVTKSNFNDALKLPKMAKTRQCDWALILSRLNALAWLCKLNVDTNNPANTQWMNRISRGIKLLTNDRIFVNQLPAKDAEDIMDFIELNIKPHLS